MRPFPYPLGKDGKLPLLSSVADVFHSTSAHSGTLLKNNYFVNSGAQLSYCNILCVPHSISFLLSFWRGRRQCSHVDSYKNIDETL